MSDVTFRRIDLSGSDFRRAIYAGPVTFDECRLDDSLFGPPSDPQASDKYALRNATWSHCRASRLPINLERTNLRDARMEACAFPHAMMSGAEDRGSVIRGTDLAGADLTGATFFRTSFLQGNLSDVSVHNTGFTDVTFANPRVGWSHEPWWLCRFGAALKGTYRRKWTSIVNATGPPSSFAAELHRRRQQDEALHRVSQVCSEWGRCAAPLRLLLCPPWYVLNQPARILQVAILWLAGLALQIVSFSFLYQELGTASTSSALAPYLLLSIESLPFLSAESLPVSDEFSTAARIGSGTPAARIYIVQVFLSWLMAGLFFVHLSKYATESS